MSMLSPSSIMSMLSPSNHIVLRPAASTLACAFEAALLTSGHPAFSSIKDCKMNMTVAPVIDV